MAALSVVSCNASSKHVIGDGADGDHPQSNRTTSAPLNLAGWTPVAQVRLPDDGRPVAVFGSGRYRTFGWADSVGGDAHRWGVADLKTETVQVSQDRERWTTTGNWSTSDRVVHVLLQQPPDQESVRFKVTSQILPNGPSQQIDSSSALVPLFGQPSVVFVGSDVMWSRADATCDCYRLLMANQRPDSTLARPREILRQKQNMAIKSDGRQVLLLSHESRVLDPVTGHATRLDVQGIASGALRGSSLALLINHPGTGNVAPSSEVVLYRLSGHGRLQESSHTEVPPETGQIDFIDRDHLLIFTGQDDTVLDLRSREESPLPMGSIDVVARYAVGDGTLTMTTQSEGHSWLSVYRPPGG